MSRILTIAGDEWRYWRRSRLGLIALGVGLALAVASAVVTAAQLSHAEHERTHLQGEAETTFLEQPDRHPHRMVHYGHYVFRAPAPLAMIDPGVDAYTGSAIFLEGHRQNTATFSGAQSSAGLSWFGALTPAFLLQVLAPLLLILMGYNVITREKEARTLDQMRAQGVSALTVLTGKGLALAGAAGLILAPLAIASLTSVAHGEALSIAIFFTGGYGLYLLIWCVLGLLISTVCQSRSASLAVLLTIWIGAALIAPRLASSTATGIVSAPSKIALDFDLIKEKKKVGDGHNASDPAFAKLKAEMLAQYGVDKVDELPVNFRGVVAEIAEANLTDLLNQFAEERMSRELEEARVARAFGWASPVLAVREFSMRTGGTDLETHHRFLREAEAVRIDFVQSLNRAHAEKLTYADDIRRSDDEASSQRSRISSENWKALNAFRFEPTAPSDRVGAALSPLAKLLFWLTGLIGLCAYLGRRML